MLAMAINLDFAHEISKLQTAGAAARKSFSS